MQNNTPINRQSRIFGMVIDTQETCGVGNQLSSQIGNGENSQLFYSKKKRSMNLMISFLEQQND